MSSSESAAGGDAAPRSRWAAVDSDASESDADAGEPLRAPRQSAEERLYGVFAEANSGDGSDGSGGGSRGGGGARGARHVRGGGARSGGR